MNTTRLKIIKEYKSSPYPSLRQIASNHGVTHQAIHYTLKTHYTDKEYMKLKKEASEKRRTTNKNNRESYKCKTCKKHTANEKYCSIKCSAISRTMDPEKKKRRKAKKMKAYYIRTMEDRKASMKKYYKKHYIPISKR